MTTGPAVAVGAIIIDKGSILLVRRDQEPARGLWSLPGGRVERGESLREAIVREVREETAVDVEVDFLLGVAERVVRDDDGDISFHYVILDYVCLPRTFDVKFGDDVSDARWIPVGELTDMQLTTGLLEFLADRGVLEGRRLRADR